MTHEDTFFDSTLREAVSGQTPPDVLARVLERANAPRSESATGRSSAGRVTTRRWIARVLGAFCLSVLAGGAASLAAMWFAPPAQPDSVETALSGAEQSLENTQARVAEYDARVLRRQAELERLSDELAALDYRLCSPEEKVERALVANERERADSAEKAEIARRERHVAWAQEVSTKQRNVIMDGLVSTVGVNANQKQSAEKILNDWGDSVLGAIRKHYPAEHGREGAHRADGRTRGDRRGPSSDHRRPEARECADSVLMINRETLDALRGLLDGRQQLAFDGWLVNGGGGVLKRGTDPWLPPAVDLDDVQSFDEWRR
ncbi:hypothetical protein PLCT2_02746 [Planctomycetaceae bacterium]|nr:hypothetical protein PLCT2_02746 [Planctomycetaceae bacterium]